jgi:hypothetical protein
MEPSADHSAVRDAPHLGTSPDELRAALLVEVDQIVSYGPDVLSNPELIPILAELTLGSDGDPELCREMVRGTLLNALNSIDGFGTLSRQELAKAIPELLGIGKKAWKNQEDRFENAASELHTYKNGESLRRSRRKREGETKFVYTILLELLIAPLLDWATETKFSATGAFQGHSPELKPTTQTSAVQIYRAIVYLAEIELPNVLFSDGLYAPVEKGLHLILEGGMTPDEAQETFSWASTRPCPTLIALAETTYPYDVATRTKVEALLTWAIGTAYDGRDSAYYTKQQQVAAVMEIVGLGKLRGGPLPDRLRRAEHMFEGDFGRRLSEVWLGEGERDLQRIIAYKLAPPLCELGLAEGVKLPLWTITYGCF